MPRPIVRLAPPLKNSPSGTHRRAPPKSRPKPAASEPTVLVVGAHDKMLHALKSALAGHGTYVETASAAGVVDSVVVAAPDLVLLVGDAALDGGREVLDLLAASAAAAAVPVALLSDDADLATRIDAFRHGAAAIIPRTASIDALAREVAALAREIPNRSAGEIGEIGEATLEELVQTLASELRTGILSVHSGAESDEPLRIVLDRGKPLATIIDDFVKRVRQQVVHAEPLKWEFDDHADGTVDVLNFADPDAEAPAALEGLRIVLADDDAARADAVAQELRGRGAKVVVSDLDPSETHLGRLRQHDPAVLVLGSRHLQGVGYELLRRVRADARLRWASLLVVSWDELWHDGELGPLTTGLLQKLGALADAERGIRDCLRSGEPFDTRLDGMGPARLIRLLATTVRPLRVSVTNPRFKAQLHFAEGLLAGADGQPSGEPALEGVAALASLLVLGSGRVHVEPAEHVGAANIMSPADVALAQAEEEADHIEPSVVAPAPDEAAALSLIPRIPRQPTLPGFLERDDALGDPSTGVRAKLHDSQAPTVTPPPRIDPDAPSVMPPPGQIPSQARPPVFGSEPPTLKRRGTEPAADVETAAPIAEAAADAETAVPIAEPVPAKLEKPANDVDPAQSATLARRKQLGVVVAGLIAFVAGFGGVLALLRAVSPAPASAITVPRAAVIAPAPASRAEPARAPVPAAPSAEPAPASAAQVVREPQGKSKGCSDVASDGEGAVGASNRALADAKRGVVAGDLPRAEEAYCRALAFTPRNAAALTGLVTVLILEGDGDAAVGWAKKAAELQPEDSSLRGLYADALALAGDDRGARDRLLAEARSADGASAAVALADRYIAQAEAALAHRGFARAERMYRRAAVLAPDSAAAARGLAHVLDAQGGKERAEWWTARAVEITRKAR